MSDWRSNVAYQCYDELTSCNRRRLEYEVFGLTSRESELLWDRVVLIREMVKYPTRDGVQLRRYIYMIYESRVLNRSMWSLAEASRQSLKAMIMRWIWKGNATKEIGLWEEIRGRFRLRGWEDPWTVQVWSRSMPDLENSWESLISLGLRGVFDPHVPNAQPKPYVWSSCVWGAWRELGSRTSALV